MGLIVSAPIPSLTVGGRVFTDLTNLIALIGYATTGKSFTFRRHNASAGFQVTAGKTLKVYAARFITNATAAGGTAPFSLCYADNDIGIDSAVAFTNQVYLGGASTLAALPANIASIQSGYEVPIYFDIPAEKYPGCNMNISGNATCWLFGYEVSA